jgi:hypothetical protein
MITLPLAVAGAELDKKRIDWLPKEVRSEEAQEAQEALHGQLDESFFRRNE